MFLLLIPCSVFSEQKNKSVVSQYTWVDKDGVTHIERVRGNISVANGVYTNEDLKKYEGNKQSFSENVLPKKPFVLPSVPSVEPPREIIYNGDVRVRLSGCITLQDSIDKKFSGSGAASVVVPGDGRTEKQLCESVGRGCEVCQVSFVSQH